MVDWDNDCRQHRSRSLAECNSLISVCNLHENRVCIVKKYRPFFYIYSWVLILHDLPFLPSFVASVDTDPTSDIPLAKIETNEHFRNRTWQYPLTKNLGPLCWFYSSLSRMMWTWVLNFGLLLGTKCSSVHFWFDMYFNTLAQYLPNGYTDALYCSNRNELMSLKEIATVEISPLCCSLKHQRLKMNRKKLQLQETAYGRTSIAA